VVLSKRERYIAVLSVSALAILALDRLALEPLMAQKQALEGRIAAARLQIAQDTRLLATSRRLNTKWANMLKAGLRKDASEAESQVLHNVRDWAQDAQISLSSVKPERTEKEKDFYKITLRATGTGSMSQIGRFLWRIQTAPVPARITDLQINSRKEGTDDLSLTLGVSTIYLAPESEKPAKPIAAASLREDLQ
jgi:hypothetical protein